MTLDELFAQAEVSRKQIDTAQAALAAAKKQNAADRAALKAKAREMGLGGWSLPSFSAGWLGWVVALGLAGVLAFTQVRGCDFPPGPGPTPPGPTPGPGPKPPTPVPVPTGELRVLMVTDPADTSMPAAQTEVLYSAQVRDWLNAHTPLGPDGKTHEWRLWPVGVDVTNEATLWQELYKRADKVPCLVISKGSTVEVVPLPGSVDEAMALLGKYA